MSLFYFLLEFAYRKAGNEPHAHGVLFCNDFMTPVWSRHHAHFMIAATGTGSVKHVGLAEKQPYERFIFTSFLLFPDSWKGKFSAGSFILSGHKEKKNLVI